jgi:hypothetical protein
MEGRTDAGIFVASDYRGLSRLVLDDDKLIGEMKVLRLAERTGKCYRSPRRSKP